LTPNWSRTAFPGLIPSKKAIGTPNVYKSYGIPIKTRKEKADQTNLGSLWTRHHPRS
jgi:hypothetical protein